MNVPLALLGLLEREPGHGYDLKRNYDTHFGRSKQLPFGHYLDKQRSAHIRRMQELTERRRDSALVDMLLADHALFHLEADLRWIDVTSARLAELAALVSQGDR